jgi:CRP-like cAMP-binding protein/ribonuclease BN (tRNA processing enzyme)
MGKLGFAAVSLPRGGRLISAPNFQCQIGAYPETIKDTLGNAEGVPDLYILPEVLFDTKVGISAAELEFPVYFNFYIKRRRLRFICRPEQLRPILSVLREALFGPLVLDHEGDYVDGKETLGYPDLRREQAWFKEDASLPGGKLRLKYVIQPIVLDENGETVVDGVRIRASAGDLYTFERGQDVLEVQYEGLAEPTLMSLPVDPLPEHEVFVPPTFGITVIGSGHGFDKETSTSGFILWVDQKGIMVDPPVNSTAWCSANGINMRWIGDLILTHCHADHDSGTLQKILEEGRIRVHTTPTVIRSFLTKYSALTGLSRQELSSLFIHEPVLIGQPIGIQGARFSFHYNLHPVPTMGFSCSFQGKDFAYSCDTLYDPETYQLLRDRDVISEARMTSLMSFPWSSTVILHEAGVPPIHTPISVLANLPEEVKKRLHLVHVSKSAVPEDRGLRLAPTGTVNTIRIPVPMPKTSLANRMLDVLAHIDLFREMRIEKAGEFLAITGHSVHEAGEKFIEKGTVGDRFYMILSGEAEISPGHVPSFIFGRYGYVGEMALILNQPRSADVIARTKLELLYIERHDFLAFIRGTRLPDVFRRIAQNRVLGSWSLFEENKVLRGMSPFQKSSLTAILHHERFSPDQALFSESDRVLSYFLIDQGQVELDGRICSRGHLIGELDRHLRPKVHSGTARAITEVAAYRIRASDFRSFFQENPGTYVRLLECTSDPSRHSAPTPV